MEVAKVSRDLLDHCMTDADLRLKETAFTRQRKLGPQRLLLILLHRLAACLQLAIDTYFKSVEEDSVSKQAFSKARAGLNPEFVRKFADGIASVHARAEDAPSYQGMRLIAIDGTDIALENSQELKDAFGCSGPKNDAATALGSLAYGGRLTMRCTIAKSRRMPLMSVTWQSCTWHGSKIWGWVGVCCFWIAGIRPNISSSKLWMLGFLLSCACAGSGTGT